MLVLKSCTKSTGFDKVTNDELFFINGGSGSSSGGNLTSRGYPSSTDPNPGKAPEKSYFWDVVYPHIMNDSCPPSDPSGNTRRSYENPNGEPMSETMQKIFSQVMNERTPA